jgi:hypothetical protein
MQDAAAKALWGRLPDRHRRELGKLEARHIAVSAGFASRPAARKASVTDQSAGNREEGQPIRIVSERSRWVVDYGGGITQRFSSRDEAIAHAQNSADREGRKLILPS